MYCGKKCDGDAGIQCRENPEKTYDEVMGQGVVDLVVVVDCQRRDQASSVAQSLSKVLVHAHEKIPDMVEI